MKKTETMEVVALTDPAIDLAKTDLRKYSETRDLSLVVEKQGEKCARYYLRPHSVSVFNRLIKPAAPSIRFERAFSFGLVQVDNLVARNGQRFDTWLPTGRPSNPSITGGETFVSDEELELFWPSVVEEIGAVSWAMSFLQPTSSVTWQLPPSLLDAYQAIFQSAEQLRRELQTSSSKPQAGSPSS